MRMTSYPALGSRTIWPLWPKRQRGPRTGAMPRRIGVSWVVAVTRSILLRRRQRSRRPGFVDVRVRSPR